MKSLYAFQEIAVAWLMSAMHRYLALDMGLGKTVVACVAAKRLGVSSVLVICPASAIENWKNEWREWGRPGVWQFQAISFARADEWSEAQAEDAADGRTEQWGLVIIDEAHYCKTKDAARTQAALKIARKAERAWLLSATPMPNHPGELWAPLRALWPGIPRALGLKRHRDWFDFFCRWSQTKYGKHVYGAKNTFYLTPYLRQIMHRKTVKDVGIDLPPLRVDVSLLPRDAKFAKALEAYGTDVESLERAIRFEEQDEDGSASRLRRLIGEYKAPLIGDLLAEELRTKQYEKIVVLAYHHSVIGILQDKLAKFGVIGFDGSASPATRQFAIDTFRDSSQVRVFLAQQSAAGIAINLQVATEIVLVEPDWSPDSNAQAIKRIHRIGSTGACRARIFAVAGTLDEGMMKVRAAKTRMQEALGLSGKDAT